jgi:hypothetical protein
LAVPSLLEAGGSFFQREPSVLVGERRQDHAQGIGLVHDLELLSAHAAARYGVRFSAWLKTGLQPDRHENTLHRRGISLSKMVMMVGLRIANTM